MLVRFTRKSTVDTDGRGPGMLVMLAPTSLSLGLCRRSLLGRVMLTSAASTVTRCSRQRVQPGRSQERDHPLE